MLETILYFATVLASASLGGGVGYVLRGQKEAKRLSERMDAEALKRRNALLDRGRTSDRRPEHDGEQPSRVHRMRVRNERPQPRG